jgi:hypothetical protein
MTRLIGVDFTSAPTRRKPITVAVGQVVSPQGEDHADSGTRVAPAWHAASRTSPDVSHASDPHQAFEPNDACVLRLHALLSFHTLPDWQDWLINSGAWVGAFDFPFGLPRAFVRDGLGWPIKPVAPWPEMTRRLAALSRPELIAHCKAWCDARPPGAKFAHRATDLPAGSSPSMKWVNPPVVLMLHAGAPVLLNVRATLPGLHEADTVRSRIALEGYPGLLARGVLGRTSYKSDLPAKRHDPQRHAARERLVQALESGTHPFGLTVDLGHGRDSCIADPGADRLDAVLCLVQAGWAWQRRAANWGLPAAFDPLEGWILGATPPTEASSA